MCCVLTLLNVMYKSLLYLWFRHVIQFCCLWLAAVQLQSKWFLCSVNSELSGRSYLGTMQSALVVDASLIQHDRDI